MSSRIDLTRFIALADKMAAAHDEMGLEGMGIHHAEAHSALLESIAELKRMYEREDELLIMAEAVKGNLLALIDALQIIKEDLDEVMEYGPFTVEQLKMLRSISNFANDISR